MRIRTYSELITIPSFEERFRYLQLRGLVGGVTFGDERYLNQRFYRSTEWRRMRDHVITRDLGNDLAVDDHEIFGRITIHHMNPMKPEDVEHGNADILDPEFLICTTHNTHNAIHYGDESLLPKPIVERRPGDTKLW
jgi:hypothetical protein